MSVDVAAGTALPRQSTHPVLALRGVPLRVATCVVAHSIRRSKLISHAIGVRRYYARAGVSSRWHAQVALPEAIRHRAMEAIDIEAAPHRC
jgi:hypothetical protein